MKSKKAFLLAEETLKILLALISIGFLVYFLYSLYFAGSKNSDLDFAKNSLEKIINASNSGINSVDIYNPVETGTNWWAIISFPLGSDFPSECLNYQGNNCLCICNVKGEYGVPDSTLAKSCDNKGICLQSNLKVDNREIKIANPPVQLSINNGKISLR